jgi:hypothetical protein
MRQKAKESGLNVLYQEDDQNPTGRCVVLVTGNDRLILKKVIYIKRLN